MIDKSELKNRLRGKIGLKDVCTIDSDEERQLVWDLIEKDNKYRWHDLRKDPTDLPKNEVEVEIAYKAYKCIKTTRAIYEDGTMHSENSDFCYTELDEWCEYCEETDDYIIPQGWIEVVHFAENMGVIDREVIAWREIEPFGGVEDG